VLRLFLIVDVELRDEKGIVALEEVFVFIEQPVEVVIEPINGILVYRTVAVVVAADELYVPDLEVGAIQESQVLGVAVVVIVAIEVLEIEVLGIAVVVIVTEVPEVAAIKVAVIVVVAEVPEIVEVVAVIVVLAIAEWEALAVYVVPLIVRHRRYRYRENHRQHSQHKHKTHLPTLH
jgi:hypothetical protein